MMCSTGRGTGWGRTESSITSGVKRKKWKKKKKKNKINTPGPDSVGREGGNGKHRVRRKSLSSLEWAGRKAKKKHRHGVRGERQRGRE